MTGEHVLHGLELSHFTGKLEALYHRTIDALDDLTPLLESSDGQGATPLSAARIRCALDPAPDAACFAVFSVASPSISPDKAREIASGYP